MLLRDLPVGTTIFIDTNCFVYHFTGAAESCRVLLERVARREVVGVTSAAVLLELHHRLLLWEIARQLPHPVRNLPGLLKSRPDLIRSARRCETALTELGKIHLRVLPMTLRLATLARRLSHEFGLLTNDALLLATMRAHDLTHLASNDTDFLSVPGITLWRP